MYKKVAEMSSIKEGLKDKNGAKIKFKWASCQKQIKMGLNNHFLGIRKDIWA